MQTNLNLSVMKLTFNFAKRLDDIELVNAVLSASNDQFILGIELFNLRFSIPTIGLYRHCIKHQKRKVFSIVAEYLYYSLMYKSITPISRYEYLDNPIAYDAILLRIRDLDAKHESIASFVNRLHSIFKLPKFNRILRLIEVSDFITPIEVAADYYPVTIRFNYLSRTITKLYTESNTTIKILMYLLLLR